MKSVGAATIDPDEFDRLDQVYGEWARSAPIDWVVNAVNGHRLGLVEREEGVAVVVNTSHDQKKNNT